MRHQDANIQAVVSLVCAACRVEVDDLLSVKDREKSWLADVRLMATWVVFKAVPAASDMAIGQAMARSDVNVRWRLRGFDKRRRQDAQWRAVSDTLLEAVKRLSGEQAPAAAVWLVAPQMTRLRVRWWVDEPASNVMREAA